MKSKAVAYLLWFCLGVFSAHRFYLKKYGTAILYLFTFQLLGIGWILDSINLNRMVNRYNLKRGHYGPIKGLNHGVIFDLNKGNHQPQQYHKEHTAAS